MKYARRTRIRWFWEPSLWVWGIRNYIDYRDCPRNEWDIGPLSIVIRRVKA